MELEGQTASAIVSALETCLTSSGFTDSYLQQNWIAFVSDGASVMLGRNSGVAKQLCGKYPHLFTWHCMNHRLELAVADAVRDVGNVFHFKAFLDSLYSLYSQSRKSNRELRESSLELGTQILKIGRILDTRWVASSYRTVKAVWLSFPALAHHFKVASEDNLRDGVERKKYEGLLARLSSVEFISDLGLMYDVLFELSTLSQELQNRSMTLPRSLVLIKRTIRVLQTFKSQPGERMEEARKANHAFILRDVRLKSNPKIRALPCAQFLQSIIDNITSRLCDDKLTSLVDDMNILDSTKWAPNPCIRHGEHEVQRLCLRFRLDSQQAVRGMRDFIEDPEREPADLKPLLQCIRTIPCSTAECERSFSLMNNIETDLRSSLLLTNIASLMFVNINGPPIDLFNCASFVKSWKLTHRSASDTQSRQCKSKPVDESRLELWRVCGN